MTFNTALELWKEHFSPRQIASGTKWVSRGQNTEPDYQDTWRKPYQSYTVRCPQKMMKNITSFHPTCSKLWKKKRSDDKKFLYSVEGGRIKDWEGRQKMRREWERLSERAPCSGADYWRLWCSHRFHEANIKATAGGKGQAETHEDSRRKGMRNAIYVIEEEHVCVCVFPCIYSYTAQHPPTLCLFHFKGHLLVKLSGLALIFYTAAANENLGMNSEALWLGTS